ncbi:hypothetical protein LTR53_019454, partial [Teratosphaeriaceae sp. CCFEE 6253]
IWRARLRHHICALERSGSQAKAGGSHRGCSGRAHLRSAAPAHPGRTRAKRPAPNADCPCVCAGHPILPRVHLLLRRQVGEVQEHLLPAGAEDEDAVEDPASIGPDPGRDRRVGDPEDNRAAGPAQRPGPETGEANRHAPGRQRQEGVG